MLPTDFVIFDTEFTAWEGSHERGWSGNNEHRELIQLGAIRVQNLQEVDSLLLYCKPVINPQLSDYIINLTGVTQTDVDERGLSFETLFEQFIDWANGLAIYSYGTDMDVLDENHQLYQTGTTANREQFHDVRTVFKAHGVDTDMYQSGTIPKAFGVTPPPAAHDALNDARSILIGLRALYGDL